MSIGLTSEETHRIFAKVFGSDAGRHVLKVLRDNFLERPAWLPGEKPSVGYFREGQNDIVRKIIDAVDAGRTQK